MRHRPPREVVLGTPDRPITIYVFHEGNSGWKEKSVEEPYRGVPALDTSSPFHDFELDLSDWKVVDE